MPEIYLTWYFILYYGRSILVQNLHRHNQLDSGFHADSKNDTLEAVPLANEESRPKEKAGVKWKIDL